MTTQHTPEYNAADNLVADDQGLVNAQLIAAAPELLEALEFDITFLRSAAMLNREAFDSCAWETLRDAAELRANKARATIAKARGEKA